MVKPTYRIYTSPYVAIHILGVHVCLCVHCARIARTHKTHTRQDSSQLTIIPCFKLCSDIFKFFILSDQWVIQYRRLHKNCVHVIILSVLTEAQMV